MPRYYSILHNDPSAHNGGKGSELTLLLTRLPEIGSLVIIHTALSIQGSRGKVSAKGAAQPLRLLIPRGEDVPLLSPSSGLLSLCIVRFCFIEWLGRGL